MIKQKRIEVNLKDLRAPEKNVRMHPERQIKEIIKSLNKFGQCRDIVIDENNTVLAGNGLWEAMKKRGDEKADAVRLVGLSDKEKLKFMLADNKTFSLGVDDLNAINEIVEKLGDELDVPGYDEETLKMIVASAEEVTEKITQYGTIDEAEINAIKAKGEHMKEYAEAFQSNKYEENSGMDCLEENNSYMDTNIENKQPADMRRFVVCPKCGEKIWL